MDGHSGVQTKKTSQRRAIDSNTRAPHRILWGEGGELLLYVIHSAIMFAFEWTCHTRVSTSRSAARYPLPTHAALIKTATLNAFPLTLERADAGFSSKHCGCRLYACTSSCVAIWIMHRPGSMPSELLPARIFFAEHFTSVLVLCFRERRFHSVCTRLACGQRCLCFGWSVRCVVCDVVALCMRPLVCLLF